MPTRGKGLSGNGARIRRVSDRPYTSCHIGSHWSRGTFSVEKRKHVKSLAAEAIAHASLFADQRTRHAARSMGNVGIVRLFPSPRRYRPSRPLQSLLMIFAATTANARRHLGGQDE